MEKKPWQSKTVWVALITAVAAFIPAFQAEITKNPELVVSTLGLIFMLLRLISKDKIVIS